MDMVDNSTSNNATHRTVRLTRPSSPELIPPRDTPLTAKTSDESRLQRKDRASTAAKSGHNPCAAAEVVVAGGEVEALWWVRDNITRGRGTSGGGSVVGLRDQVAPGDVAEPCHT